MTRRELQKCCVCGRGVAHAGQVQFYRVKVESFMLDARAIQRRAGLEEFFGGGTAGARLAEIMGDDADIAHRVSDPPAVLVCQECMLSGVSAIEVGQKEPIPT